MQSNQTLKTEKAKRRQGERLRKMKRKREREREKRVSESGSGLVNGLARECGSYLYAHVSDIVSAVPLLMLC